MTHSKVDVLIVGAGPAGSTLAVDLVRRGVKTRIIERNERGFPGSRAKGIQPRSLELFEDIGALDDILAAGSTYPPLGIHLGPVRIPKKMQKIVRSTEPTPYPNTWLISQSKTDAIIRARLKPFGLAVEFGTELISLVQTSDRVNVQVNSSTGPETVQAKYVVGADGGASMVRRSVGIPFSGTTDDADRIVIVDCQIEGLGRNHWHVWPKLGGRFAGACPLPGGKLFQVMIRLKPNEEPQMDDASLNARFCKQTGTKKFHLSSIQWKTVFRPNIRLAEKYRKDSVFLIGDAAHVHTPMGAQGLNTGVQDAYNLGWKLGQVLAGASNALLSTYEEERQPVAARVLGLSTKTYEALSKLDPASAKRGEDEHQLTITYRAGPLGSTALTGTEKLVAGDRAPDARLSDEAGNALRLFEITRGPHFTLLALGPSAAEEMDSLAWPEKGTPLKRVAIDTDGLGRADLRVTDKSNSFKSVYGVKGNVLILIRPDGYLGEIARTKRGAAIERIMALVTP